MKVITSVTNNLIQQIAKLDSQKDILKNGLCFVESEKVIFDLAKQNCLKTVLVESSKLNGYKKFLYSLDKSVEVVEITELVAKKIANSVTHTGIFALSTFSIAKELSADENFVVLDGVQDPTNVGAIIRTALAFNIKNIVFLNSAFAFSPKVIRTSMGYVFNINVITMTKSEFLEKVKKENIHLVAGTMQGQNIAKYSAKLPFGIVVGNEGNGISTDMLQACKSQVSVPMHNGVESLNVAVSLAIIMYELTK